MAHQALERIAMNAVEMEELLDQPRRMIDSPRNSVRSGAAENIGS
jgi:hypothetical protein